MYEVREGVDSVAYEARDFCSRMPRDVANELIRTSDSYREDGGTLAIDGGYVFRLCDLERLAR